MRRALTLLVLLAAACGGAKPRSTATDRDLDDADLKVSAGPDEDVVVVTPARGPVALEAALNAIGPITADTTIDELPQLLPGDRIEETTVISAGRSEPAALVWRGETKLLTLFPNAQRHVGSAWIHSAAIGTVWNVDVGTSHAEAVARLGPLACVALELEDSGRAGCSTPMLAGVVLVMEPVGVWVQAPRTGASAADPRDDGDGRFVPAPRGEVAPVQLAKARVLRILWWPTTTE